MSPTWLHWPSTWTPSNLASLRAWYDADDSSTIFDATTGGSLPSSGNDVARWEDKSGGGYHVTQGTAANCPHYVTNTLNGKPVIECTSQWLTAATASDWNFLHQAGGSTIAAVWQAGTSVDPNTVYGLVGTLADDSLKHGLQIAYDDRASFSRNDRIGCAIGRGASPLVVGFQTANDEYTANTAHLLVVRTDPGNATAADRSFINIDGGTAIATNAQTGTASTSAATHPLDIGSVGNATWQLTGYIAEVVICDALLSQSDREKLEGYLAHKWGLEANLPSTHPYRNSAP